MAYQGNPFGAPAAAGPYGAPNIHQPSGNPFDQLSGQSPAPTQSDQFSSHSGPAAGDNASASGPGQQPHYNPYAAPPAQQQPQGFAQQPHPSLQQKPPVQPPQQGFAPQPAEQPPQQQTPQPQFSVEQQSLQTTPPQQQQPPQIQQDFAPQPKQPPQQQPWAPQPQVSVQQQPLQTILPQQHQQQQPQMQQGFAPQPEQPPQQQPWSPQPPFSVQQRPPQTTPQQQPQQQYGGYPTAVAGELPFSTALVPSQQPANSYAAYAAPVQRPTNPYGGETMVPVTQHQQQQSQWTVSGPASTAGGIATGNPFDPFAPPPAPAPAPPPLPPSIMSNALVPSSASQGYYQAPEFPFDADNQIVAAQEQNGHPPPGTQGPPVNEVNAIYGGHSVVSEPETTLTRRSEDRDREMVPYEAPRQPSPQNKYSQTLAQNAGPGCAPLPKGEMVMKSGYILARISFRTILMKKWKQSYWVQYGRHTMLWFRSENHFNEWLSNPYLSPAQRNFLVKLAINFVHDLYQPNVRGYQVTQAHSKPYNGKIIRQFKLERWMDYGPTIAAAFGSADDNEVDVLRQTIVDCMRNTPLENGIRATGAVRHGQEGHRDGYRTQPFSYDDQPPRHASELVRANLDGDQQSRASVAPARSLSAPTGGRSVSSMNDLLDDNRGYSASDTASFRGHSYSQARTQQMNQQNNNYSQAPAQTAGGRSVASVNDLLDDNHAYPAPDPPSFGGHNYSQAPTQQTKQYNNYSQAPAQQTNQQYAGYR